MAWSPQPSGPTVGLVMMMGPFPHPPASLLPPPASQPPPSASPPPLSWVRASWLGMGGELERGASTLPQLEPLLASLEQRTHLSHPSWA